MQPPEALDLINKVTSTFSGTRQDHVQIQMALETLEGLVRSTELNRKDDSKEEDQAEETREETSGTEE